MGDIKNYQHAEAVRKLRDLIEDADIAMLCTDLTSVPFSSCPMATQAVDDDGTIWFFSSRASEHNRDIQSDNRVQLLYASPGMTSYLSVYGRAEILFDRKKIDDLWSPAAKVWFQQGQDDPDLSLLKVTPEEGYYWDTKNGRMVAFLKMAASLVTGKTKDDGVKGRLDV